MRSPVPLRTLLSIGLCLAALLAGAEASQAQPQALLSSIARTTEVRSGRYRPVEPVDLVRFEPDLSQETYPFLTRQNLEAILGDVNRNGEFDDAPADIDALTWLGTTSRPSVYDLVLSFAAASTPLGGGVVLDGDLVRLQPGGSFLVVASEAEISSVTATRTIDVDAAAFLPSGELLLSFTEDEVTTHALLIQQNGGSSTLGDETILGWKPGTTEVRIVYTTADVIQMVSRATQKTISSVVNVVGLAPDPVNPGAVLFTVASTAKGLVGAVFTTAGGGAYAYVNGKVLDGTGEWGLGAAATLDALLTYAGGKDPLALEVEGKRLPAPGSGAAEVRFHGAVPQTTVQFVLSYAGPPAPWPLPSPLHGVLFGYPTPGDPLFGWSIADPRFRAVADAEGRGRLPLAPGAHPPGFSVLIQALDLASGEVSEPVVIDLVQP
ncbi:MAG: hypothetical protein JXQ29_11945 [Planctomycetes bacterium]|nr:hypothetical protein [Planctomycetota bacterium]